MRGRPPKNEFYKEYEGQKRILWLDAPGKKRLKKQDLPFFVVFAFEAAVGGAFGTCRCKWFVTMEVDKDGYVIDNSMTPAQCRNE